MRVAHASLGFGSAEYVKALKRFTAFVIKGKIPDDLRETSEQASHSPPINSDTKGATVPIVNAGLKMDTAGLLILSYADSWPRTSALAWHKLCATPRHFSALPTKFVRWIDM